MINYEEIGKRINEERKYLRKISQERMAEDLGMYQADISNIEKAKSGSGITDLSKLDMIADYFDIPLEKLLFGQEEKNMIKYLGDKLKLESKGYVEKVKKEHKEKLKVLIGKDPEKINVILFTCGPYYVYLMTELQQEMETVDGELKPVKELPKPHLFCFFENEVIGTMVCSVADVFATINQELLAGLCQMIQRDVLDPTDACRTFNPYWALAQFEQNEKKKEEYITKMFERMDELKKVMDTRLIFIESVYVRDGYRRNGMMRLMLDVIKELGHDCVIWLNMEPTAGFELEDEYTYFPSYVNAATGQLSENAAIAEKLGFTIDPDIWHKRVYIEDEDGYTHSEIIQMRKCAYMLSEGIKEIIKDDGNLVEIGRAKQKAVQMEEEPTAYNDNIFDLNLDDIPDVLDGDWECPYGEEDTWDLVGDQGYGCITLNEKGENAIGVIHQAELKCSKGPSEGGIIYAVARRIENEYTFGIYDISVSDFPEGEDYPPMMEWEGIEEMKTSEFCTMFEEMVRLIDERYEEDTKKTLKTLLFTG